MIKKGRLWREGSYCVTLEKAKYKYNFLITFFFILFNILVYCRCPSDIKVILLISFLLSYYISLYSFFNSKISLPIFLIKYNKFCCG